jgi:rhodanese-related sulfurtransferase
MQRRAVVAGVMVASVLALAVFSAAGTAVKDVSVEQAKALLDRPPAGLVVLDVRTPEEFADGHLGGAQNVNVLAPDFEQRVGKLDRGKPYLVYCRTGNRSVRAVQTMTRLGFTSISHMTEGIVAWQGKRLPLVK